MKKLKEYQCGLLSAYTHICTMVNIAIAYPIVNQICNKMPF